MGHNFKTFGLSNFGGRLGEDWPSSLLLCVRSRLPTLPPQPPHTPFSLFPPLSPMPSPYSRRRLPLSPSSFPHPAKPHHHHSIMSFGQKGRELLQELKRSDWLPLYSEDAVSRCLLECQGHMAQIRPALAQEMVRMVAGRERKGWWLYWGMGMCVCVRDRHAWPSTHSHRTTTTSTTPRHHRRRCPPSTWSLSPCTCKTSCGTSGASWPTCR